MEGAQGKSIFCYLGGRSYSSHVPSCAIHILGSYGLNWWAYELDKSPLCVSRTIKYGQGSACYEAVLDATLQPPNGSMAKAH